MIKVVVTSCQNCPLCHELDLASGYICKGVKQKKPKYIDIHPTKHTAVTPDWCPLNGNPMTIQKKGIGIGKVIRNTLKEYEQWIMASYGEPNIEGALDKFMKRNR